MNAINGIHTTTLNKVIVQANGIIRNEKGYLIARLVSAIDYNGEHIQGLNNMDTIGKEYTKGYNIGYREGNANALHKLEITGKCPKPPKDPNFKIFLAGIILIVVAFIYLMFKL